MDAREETIVLEHKDRELYNLTHTLYSIDELCVSPKVRWLVFQDIESQIWKRLNELGIRLYTDEDTYTSFYNYIEYYEEQFIREGIMENGNN